MSISAAVGKWRRRRLLRAFARYSDVVVVPYEELLTGPSGGHDHRGGPIWPNWEKQQQARFNRAGKPRDVKPRFAQPVASYSGKNFVWVGPIHSHFGHGVSEFYTRLVCSLKGIDSPVLVFSSAASEPIADLQQTPKWFQGLLAWYNIAPAQVLLVNEPSLFDQLIVYPQAEQLPDRAPKAAYLDLLDEITIENTERLKMTPIFDESADAGAASGVTYVSRAAMHTCFGGESYLESVLELLGVNVFHPQRHGVIRQLNVYCSSRQLIFAEGSAIHGTQLLGRALGSVTVLVRRPGERFCEAFVRPRSKELEYVDCTRGIIHGETYRGLPAVWDGMPLLDEVALLQWLDRCGLAARGHWDSGAFRRKERQDIINWLTFHRDQPHTESSKKTIVGHLAALGFADMVAQAEQILAVS